VKNSVYKAKEIILALIFIAIFNPLTISLIVSKTVFRSSALSTGTISSNNNVAGNNIPPESVCGLRITEIIANSKVREAGIEKGNIIMKFNGMEIKSVQDMFEQLDDKKPGDKVSMETERGSKTVELARDLNNPNRPVLGVKLEPDFCGKVNN
jgi:S1-C subfamily serine protease